jgi:DNA polymerase III sliding clamp (beta) subunit (PCNA family)
VAGSFISKTPTTKGKLQMKEIVLPVMALKEALPGLNKVVSKRSSLPVLQHVRLARDTQGKVTIQATDLDAFATYTAKEPVTGPALEMLLPMNELAKTVKPMNSEGTIGFILDSKDRVKLRYSIGGNLVERVFNTLPANEFPPMPTVNQPAMPLEPGFGVALRQALECCSEDSSRAILNGACLDVTDKKFHYIVGTNGRCLFSANSFCFDLKQPVVIPDCKFLQWPDLMDEEPASLSVEPGEEEQPAKNGKPKKEATAGWIKLQSGRWTFITKEIMGKFPNWKQVNPEVTSKWTRVQLSDEAIKQLVLVTPSLPGDDGINRAVRLRVESDQILVEGQNRDDATWTSIPIQNVKVTGKPVSVGLNRGYFTNALRFGLNELVVEDPLSPVVFSKGGKKLIIMPVNLDGPARVQVSPQPQPASEATTPAAEKPQPPAETGAQTEERTEVKTRATTPVATTTATQPAETQPANNGSNNGNGTGNSNGNGNGSAVKALVEHVEQIKENLKGVIRDLSGLIDVVKAADKERKVNEKEIEAVRSKLRQIQSVAI